MASNIVNTSIVMYISFTFLFFIIKYRFFPENGLVWILIFLVISCIFQILQNLSLTSSPSMCGKPDLQMAIYSTVVPWVVIFALFTIAMTAMPGWIRVFSNTFGVFAAEAFGLKETANAVLKKPITDNLDPVYLKMLDNIYTDMMALVLELNIDDVKTGKDPESGDISITFPALQKLVELKFMQGPDKEGQYSQEELKHQTALYKALLLRENVGYFFWFLLIGIFCILVSTNSLLASTCSPNVVAAQTKIFG
jgi:hypothetical protein